MSAAPKFRSLRRRNRSKVFVKRTILTADALPETPVRLPTRTASGKKLALSPPLPKTTPSVGERRLPASTPLSPRDTVPTEAEMEGYRLVRCEALADAVSEVGKCRECESPLTVREELGCRRGLVSRLSIQCSSLTCSTAAYLTDPYSEEAKALNTSSVLGMRMIGRGRSGLETFCAIMNMLPPVSATSYSEHNSRIREASAADTEACQLAASVHLHDIVNVPHDEAIDVCVTCDGTWSKRGFTALYRVVVVASWDSGQVLDCELVSKYCPECARAHERLHEDSDEFKLWWEGHQASCNANYTGSSPAMEATGALQIWKRSEAKLKLRYTTMISDGDAKTVQHLNENKPYREGVMIEKHECVGHVQKRMGTQLRTLKKSGKRDSSGKAVKFGGRGRLTDKVVDQLQVYYGGAIRGHPNDLAGMERAIYMGCFLPLHLHGCQAAARLLPQRRGIVV